MFTISKLSFRVVEVEFLVPASEVAEAGAEGGRGAEAEVTFQGGGVGVGHGDVAGLHRHEFLVGLEIVVGGQDAGGDEFFLKDTDEVEKVLGVAIADVVDGVWRYGKSVVAGGAGGGFLHHADYAFDDVVDIGEVAAAVAVVENFYGVAAQELVGESEVCHVGASGRSVDGEKPQARRGDVVELGVGVGHELVAFLGGGVERHGIVDLVVGRIWYFLIRAVDRGAGGVDKMAHAVAVAVVGVAAGFEDVVESDEIGLNVGVGIRYRVANAGLGGQVDDYLRLEFGEQTVNQGFVGDIAPDEAPGAPGMRLGGFLDFGKAEVLDGRVVVVVEAVDAQDVDRFFTLEELQGEVGADESGRSGYQYFHFGELL